LEQLAAKPSAWCVPAYLYSLAYILLRGGGFAIAGMTLKINQGHRHWQYLIGY